MPNWCTNTLTITGAAADLANLKELLASTETVTAVNPSTGLPETHEISADLRLMNIVTPWTNEQEKTAFHSTGDWYDMSLKAWGVKWDVDGTLSEDSTPERLIYAFDSAWGPPAVAIATCAANWPNLTFELDYDEPGNDFAGQLTYQDGTLTEQIEGQSRHFYCDTCESSSYFDFDEERICPFEDPSEPSLPVLFHQLNNPESTTDILAWAAVGTLNNIEAGLEHNNAWTTSNLEQAIANSNTLATPDQRAHLIVALHDQGASIPEWLAGALLSGLTATDVEGLAHNSNPVVAEVIARGIATKLK